MSELLLTCVQRFIKDPKAFEARLAGRAVILYEPTESSPAEAADDAEDSAAFRFRTTSGIGGALGQGDPTIAYLEKTKDNAFQRRITLGRTGNNDIEIDAPSVSRFHAWFVRDEKHDGWSIVDAGSKNGTMVGGKKLKPKEPVALSNGVVLKVGHVELTYFTAEGFLGSLKTRSA